MKIALIEPFYSGSHKKWADELKNNSMHEIIIISLKGVFWKWRMHGGAITLSEKYNSIFSNYKPDLILATDMVNLPVFLSLINNSSNIPVLFYFHENQLTYPWSTQDTDIIKKRDHHYGFINYVSALVSSQVLFNSKFHKNSFIQALKKFLIQFPDNNGIYNIEKIEKKSRVTYLGLDLDKFDGVSSINKKNKYPIILWNHRWEYDKNPKSFFSCLRNVKKMGDKFNLIVLGQEFDTQMKEFTTAKQEFKDEIIHFGYCKDPEDYKKYLLISDIIPVTSIQEFFGISVMEAVFCNTYPILPNRLTYPELFDSNENKEIFYNDDNELIEKLHLLLNQPDKINNHKYHLISSRYNWKNMIKEYDEIFEKLVAI